MKYIGRIAGLRPGWLEGWRELLLEARGYGLMLFLVRPEAKWKLVAGSAVEVDHDNLGALTDVVVNRGCGLGDAMRPTCGAAGRVEPKGAGELPMDKRGGKYAVPRKPLVDVRKDTDDNCGDGGDSGRGSVEAVPAVGRAPVGARARGGARRPVAPKVKQGRLF